MKAFYVICGKIRVYLRKDWIDETVDFGKEDFRDRTFYST